MAGGGNFAGPVETAIYPHFYLAASQALIHGKGTGTDSTYTARVSKGVLEALTDALATLNPWTGRASVDPTPYTRQMGGDLTSLLNGLRGLNASTDWGTFFDTCKTKLDAVFLDAASLDDAVTAFDNRMGPERAQRVNEVLGALYLANAAEGSTIINAMAILRRGFSTETAAKRSDLEIQVAAQEAQSVLQGVGQAQQAQQFQLEGLRLAVALTQEYVTLVINSLREQALDEGTYRTNEATFILDLYPRAGNVLASFSGGVAVPVGPSKLSAALSGALAGASQGVTLGSKAGVGGALFGGVVGGLLGGGAAAA